MGYHFRTKPIDGEGSVIDALSHSFTTVSYTPGLTSKHGNFTRVLVNSLKYVPIYLDSPSPFGAVT
jgi:hypothetical protein